MKKISVLGSTGSIGTQTLEIVRSCGDIQVTALAVRSNTELLEQQIREFRPRIAAVWDEERAADLKVRVADTKTRVVSGMEGVIAAATETKAETVVAGMVGMVGIRPAIAAIRCGKDIALANKETLVCAGHIIIPLAKECGVKILPVDSEHSAIFQCLRGNKKNRIARILLTASGGPFRKYSAARLKKVTLEDALKHPNWNMGAKVTIDSSTMANKGLEVMEAHWLFDVNYDDIQVVIQPQSIIHSMVEFEDGAVMAQLGVPDMRLPIQYALTFPRRRPMKGARLDFATLGSMECAAPDLKRFPALAMAYQAGKSGGSMPTVFNAANEAAVRFFLQRRIPWLNISDMISAAMEEHERRGILRNPGTEEILEIQESTEAWLKQRYRLEEG